MRNLLATIVILSVITPACAQAPDSSASPEEQRFRSTEQRLQHDRIYQYVRSTKEIIDRSWHFAKPKTKELLVTKIKATVNPDGKITDCQIVTASKSPQEDQFVADSLRSTVLPPPPNNLKSLDFYLTLMTDGTMNMVEFSDSPEAQKYYSELMGAHVLQGHLMSASLVGSRRPGSQRDVDMGPYMADVQRRIMRAWFPPKGNEATGVIVTFNIHREGGVSDLRLKKSSGVQIADQAALKAVENAAPFKTLPTGLNKDYVGIEFIFDYGVSSRSGRCRLI